MSDHENDIVFDEGDEGNLDSHIRLAKAISTLDKTQRILKPTREGYSGSKSEFNVSKSNNFRSGVAVNDIIKILQGSAEHADTGKKLKTAQRNNKTLRKPLEKHEAAIIKRTTGFEEIKSKLGRWDAIVARNRTLEHQKFPLENTIFKQPVTKEYLSKFTIKSELENELDVLKPAEKEPEEETFPMTMSEMLEHRKEAARLRAKQSYKEVKARRQSKIKSKKFHRIQRKEKIKQQLKDFDSLQKTDPEQALRKLEQLEKTRAQERVTLRHKSTGQWAKNKLVRAKYDKETRQQLAEQLAISRDLTQKTQILSESESEEEKGELPPLVADASNPWLSHVNQSKEVTDFVSGYKKYWENRNSTVKDDADSDLNKSNKDTPIPNESKKENHSASSEVAKVLNEIEAESTVKTKQTSKTRKRKMQDVSVKSTTEWDVEKIPGSQFSTNEMNRETEKLTVENIFDDLEYELLKKITNKLSHLKPDSKIPKKNKAKKHKDDMTLSGLEFKKKNIRPEIDEELNESTNVSDSFNLENNIVENKLNTDVKIANATNLNKVDSVNKIDPNKFVAIKPRHLQSALPDVDIEGDHLDDEENEKKLTIAEAFEDDDIVAEFQQDKDSEINKNKPQIEDLSLPGWGSWVGKGLKPSKRRKRFIFNVPKVLPRKDDKKDNVIINENKDSKLKVHQVSELPFPFTSVSDFESTVRAPIGNTFIPETAHRKLIKPAVIVKTGVVIEPMDESQLVVMKKDNHKLRMKIKKTKK